MRSRRVFIFIFLGVLILSLDSWAQDFKQLPSAIHMSSDVSDGIFSLSQIAQVLHNEGIEVVIFSDRDHMRWEYGLWPLRNIIRKRFEGGSICTYGIKEYLQDIEQLQDHYPDMILIAGIESSPFHYWQGSPFLGNLTMYNWHKHILTIGLNRIEDYKDLPVIGNPGALRESFSFVLLWPVVTLLLGIFCIARSFWRSLRLIGWALILISILFIINNWPFVTLKFDKYHGDRGAAPYQNFIDYVNDRGGLTFWAHPEARYSQRALNVQLTTLEDTSILKTTTGYTGFSIFPAGYKQVGKPSGLWDELLLDYCKGIRDKPIWVIGSLGFEKGDLKSAISRLKTVILVEEKSRESVMSALGQGKMYVAQGKDSGRFRLDKFFVCDESCNLRGFMGDNIPIQTKALLHVEASLADEAGEEFEVKVIKNGRVVKTSKLEAPFLLSYHDDNVSQGKSYYRLEITSRSKNLHLVTNPIFVVKK